MKIIHRHICSCGEKWAISYGVFERAFYGRVVDIAVTNFMVDWAMHQYGCVNKKVEANFGYPQNYS